MFINWFKIKEDEISEFPEFDDIPELEFEIEIEAHLISESEVEIINTDIIVPTDTVQINKEDDNIDTPAPKKKTKKKYYSKKKSSDELKPAKPKTRKRKPKNTDAKDEN